MKSEEGEVGLSRRAWEALELPQPESAPPGFARAVLDAARAERSLLPGFALSPAWAGLAAALILAIGVLGGAELDFVTRQTDETQSLESAADDPKFWADDGLLDESLFEPATEDDDVAIVADEVLQ